MPAISSDTLQSLHVSMSGILRENLFPIEEPAYHWSDPTGMPAIDRWIAEYKAGGFPPLPPELSPNCFPVPINSAALVCHVLLARARSYWGTRQALIEEHEAVFNPRPEQDWWPKTWDPFSRKAMLLDEHEWSMGKQVCDLALVRRSPPDLVAKVCERLAGYYEDIPLCTFAFKGEVQRLHRLLSLPVWKKRNEVYAVWICAEIIAALDDHELLFHAENQRLPFSFAAKHLATVTTSDPPVELYSERKAPISNPIGKGREYNVKPDYSIWTPKPDCICKLVVEVKHYLQPSRSKFTPTLNDYARANPAAEILLVNHGRLGNVPDLGDNSLSDRCQHVGDLTSVNPEQRKRFRGLIEKAVGPRWRPFLIVIDISMSMAPMLKDIQNTSLVGWLWVGWKGSMGLGDRFIVLADHRIHDRIERFGSVPHIQGLEMTGERDLVAVIGSLDGQAGEYLVATNEEGARSLSEIPGSMSAPAFQDSDLWVVKTPGSPRMTRRAKLADRLDSASVRRSFRRTADAQSDRRMRIACVAPHSPQYSKRPQSHPKALKIVRVRTVGSSNYAARL